MSRLKLEDGTVWPDPTTKAADDARHTARYYREHLTQEQAILLSDLVGAYRSLVDHPWGAEVSCQKVRMMRRARRAKGDG